MAEPAVFAFVIANKTNAFNGLFKDHPVLDPRGGGDETFSVMLADEATPESVTYAGCSWNLSNDWFQEFLDTIPNGWKVNDPNHPPGTDVAYYYEEEGWTWEQALADLTRKNRVLVVFEEEEIP